MRQNQQTVLDWIGLSEGGYVNHPRDPGGATDRGITQRTYDAWNDLRGVERKPVRGISKAEADQIIASQYLAPVRFDDLPSGLDYAVADYAVNSGPNRAARELQRLVGVDADGVIGAHTLAAVNQHDPAQLVMRLCAARMAFLRSLSTWDAFGAGWTVRVVGREDGVQADDIGVIDRGVMLARNEADIPAPTRVAQGRGEAEQPRAADPLRDPQMIGALAPVVGSVAAMSTGNGPMQWAVAAVLVLVAALVVYRTVFAKRKAEAST